jgi:hypothetical protein
MAFLEAVMYRAVCDCCAREAEYEGYWGWESKSSAVGNDEFMRTIGDEVLCGDCWCWPEDLPDYPGDDRWQGGDDEVRKPDCHTAPSLANEGKTTND